MVHTLTLYTTAGCHLCEQAEALIWPHLSSDEWRLQAVDIAQSDELIERYGVRIPVVAKMADDDPARVVSELGWPFDSDQFAQFLRS